MVRPWPAFTKVASWISSNERNSAVTGTLSARDNACKVPSDGEVEPFSIFDSIPAEMPDDLASSAMVRPSFSRKARTSRPIDCSRSRPSAAPVPCGSWSSLPFPAARRAGPRPDNRSAGLFMLLPVLRSNVSPVAFRQPRDAWRHARRRGAPDEPPAIDNPGRRSNKASSNETSGDSCMTRPTPAIRPTHSVAARQDRS